MASQGMFGFLKSPVFNIVFSFIIGLGIMAILKPACKGSECRVLKAPPYEEVNTATYQLGHDCYQFRASPISCPKEGVIEPFEEQSRAGED